MGASLGLVAVWLIGKGQTEVLRNDNAGWHRIGLGFRYRRAQLLCELWSKLYERTRSSFATRRLVAELLLFSALAGDERLEAFCSRILRGSFKNDLLQGMGQSPDFIALIDAKKLASTPKLMRENAWLKPCHERTIDSWGNRRFRKCLHELLDYRYSLLRGDNLDSIDLSFMDSGLAANAPLEIAWILRLRSILGLSVPRIDHPLYNDNPLLKIPRSCLAVEDDSLVRDCIRYLTEMAVNLKTIFDLRIPRQKEHPN